MGASSLPHILKRTFALVSRYGHDCDRIGQRHQLRLFKAYTRRLEGGDKQASTAVELYSIRRQDLFAVSDLETWVQRTVQLTWRQR
jgi:hypothetical protein